MKDNEAIIWDGANPFDKLLSWGFQELLMRKSNNRISTLTIMSDLIPAHFGGEQQKSLAFGCGRCLSGLKKWGYICQTQKNRILILKAEIRRKAQVKGSAIGKY